MSEPTARELLGLATQALERITSGAAPMRIPAQPSDPDLVIAKLASRVEKVLALHRNAPEMHYGNICCHCFKDWPCPTVRILNGELL